MSSLSLVFAIVDLVDKATERGHVLDVEKEAQRLLERHPEANANKRQIAALIVADGEAVAGHALERA